VNHEIMQGLEKPPIVPALVAAARPLGPHLGAKKPD
jgi:hypothetical protein